MVLAEALESNIPDDYHLIILLCEELGEMKRGVLMQPLKDLRIHPRHAVGRFEKPFPVWILADRGDSVPSQGHAIDHIGWRSMGAINETKSTLEGKSVQLTSQPQPLNLPNGPTINFFYVAGPSGTRIEIVERPGLKPGQ